jgi:hypothetical protein
MSSPFGAPNWGVFLLAIPFLCALPVGILQLDARLARRRRGRTVSPGKGINDRERKFFTARDRRLWKS